MKRLRKGVLLTLLVLCVAFGGMIAGCGKKKVTISFDTMGGAQTFESIQVKAGEDFTLQIPSREGYEFTGWYDNQSLSGTAIMGGTATAPDKDTTYYAGWSQLMKATLDANGGTFDDGTTTKEIYIAKGKKLLDVLGDYTPTHGSLQLGAWFTGSGPVDEGSVMPSREIRLTAKYSVSYFVEIYKQVSSQNQNYEHDASLDFSDLGYLDDDTTVEAPAVDGYEFFRNHPQGVPTLKLQEDSSQNLFKLYYNKQAYTIIYNVNAPEKTSFSGFMADQKVLHGEEGFAMECGYSIRSYRFAGWAKSASGNVEIKPGDKLPEGSYTLYAVWDAGYSDVFGGSDFIFFPHDGKNGDAILQRGNAEIVGRTCTRDAEGNYNEDVNGMFVKFNDQMFAYLVDSDPKTFSFFDGDLKGDYTFYNPYYEANPEVDEQNVLTLDGFDGGVIKNGEDTTNYKVSLDAETGYYKLTEADGTESLILLGTKNDKDVYCLVGTEAGEYQQFNRISVMSYAPGNYVLNLDGLGNASWGFPGSFAILGKYVIVEENGGQFIRVRFDDQTDKEFIMLNFGTLIAVSSKDDYEGEYTYIEGDQEDKTWKITLDGFDGFMGKSSLEKDGNKKTISYMVQDNIFDKVVSIIENNKVTEMYSLDPTNHHFSKLKEDYTIYKYLYTDVESGYNNISENIFLVVYAQDENGKQTAKVVRDSDDKIEVLLTGEVTPDENNPPLSKFKAQESDAVVTSEFPYKNFSYRTSDKFTVGSIFYVYTEDNPATEDPEGNFLYMKSKNGQQKIMAYAGLNTFEAYGLSGVGSYLTDTNGDIIEGSLDPLFSDDAIATTSKYFDGDNFYSFSFFNASGVIQKRYFAVYQIGEDVATATFEFEEVNDAPRALAESYVLVPKDAQTPFAMEYSLFFDGRGNAIILMDTAEGSEYIRGTYKPLGLVNELEGYSITLTDDGFTGQEVEIVISGLNSMYYYRHNRIMEGRNEIANGGYVELDGWGTHAKYVDNFGHEYEGYYCFLAGQTGLVIYPSMQQSTANISIVDGKFVNTPPEMKGISGGVWQILDQNMQEYLPNMEDAAANFDGEGGVTVEHLHNFMNWQLNGDGNEYGYKREIYGKGFYTMLSETEFELEVGFYGADGKVARTEKWRARLSNGACIKLDSDSVGSYVQESDKAVLYFDGYGTGFYIDARGNREDGNYQFFDQEKGIGLFMNENVNYMFEVKTTDNNRTFRLLNNPEKFRTFYAEDLTPLEFEYALRLDGQQVGVWYIDDNNNFVYYEFTGTGFERSDEYEYVTSDTYELELPDGRTKKFTEWKSENPAQLNLKGEIVFRAIEDKEEGKGTIKDVELSFTPDGTQEINAEAVLKYTDTIKNETEAKTYEHIYTVKRVPMLAFAGSSAYETYELFLCYGEMQFPLNVDGDTFTIWADIDSEHMGADLLQFLGLTTESFEKVDAGDGYTLGVRKWSLDDFDVEIEDGLTLLGGYAKAEDKNGDLVCFEVLWNKDRDNKEKERIVGYTTEKGLNIQIPVYEIFTRSMDDDADLVVLLEMVPAADVGDNYYISLYAACNYEKVSNVYLSDDNGKKDSRKKTEDYEIYEYRTIGTAKGFAEGGIAYFQVFKKESGESKMISKGYSMYLQSSDYMLVEATKDNKIQTGSRIFIITPDLVKTNEGSAYDIDSVTLWFGINKHVELSSTEFENQSGFKNMSFDIVLLTNTYREKEASGTDDRKVIDGWLVFLYYHEDDSDEEYGLTFRMGYEADGWTRISRVVTFEKNEKGEYRQYDLHFSGTFNDVKVSCSEYFPPKEEKGKQDSGNEG